MFGALSEKFTGIFSSLMGKGKLTEENISDAVRQVRLALLDADVHFEVTKGFIKNVKEKCLGDALLKSVSPSQQFIKILHDELVALLGGGEASLSLEGSPAVLMLVGLQGAGKTTQAAKLAHFLKKKMPKKRILLVACDLARPAAIEQLRRLGQQVELPVFSLEDSKDPLAVVKGALRLAKEEKIDLLILDTAGRLHIDTELMEELRRIKESAKPQEILFVANAAAGQDAVRAAQEFDQQLGITGTMLTMLDGDTRAGCALSICKITGKPLKFEGVGERIEDLLLFNAHSMADRILGMGDTINLVKKAQEHFSEEEGKKLEEKLRKATFTYEDYLKQMQIFRKMGPLRSMMQMLPGVPKDFDFETQEKNLTKMVAMISSMTPKERRGEHEISMERAKRIARGSGTRPKDVLQLTESFEKSRKFFKQGSNKKMLEKLMERG